MDQSSSVDDEPVEVSPVVVPLTALSPEALAGVIESFVLREGTDYGEREVSHEAKCEQMRRQLERDEARIVFDPVTGTVGIEKVERGRSNAKRQAD